MNYINKNRLIITVLIFSVAISSMFAYADNAKCNIAKSVIRLHVIANSNEEADQALKLKVRDRILKEAAGIFTTALEPEEALKKATKEKSRLLSAAKQVIKENGYNYNVEIQTGNFTFPAKNYGEIMLPAGNYDALRIVIGEGKGKNWWCVMFPPLCLAKGTVKVSKDSDAYLKSHLTESEYKLIKSDSNQGVEIRFKLLELFN